ncbi:sensor histidine kinase [Microlunatus elymi]|uniref:Oxygen sensor histidine kinase NreB n=1 Tax=Microlunatus elymi TaxID=2596828 RepID=A0A516PW65_9ACTN|nr:sensor histidine kinase [Microlunatus elymi]QDP95400.1 sensor histidine kinase [Microlunatus elymi]
MSPSSLRPTALGLLRRSEHLLFAVLLILGVVSARHTPGWPMLVAGAVLVAAWYALGIVVAGRSRDRRLATAWLVVLTLGCAGLAVGSDGFVWLAFPLFLLYAQLLPLRAAVPGVAVVTVGTIVRAAVAQGGVNAAVIVGPLIGATVAVVITIVYRDLTEQTRQRAILIDQLTATRDELATSQRRAGVLAERERLARELHDTVTQGLTSIVLVLRTLQDDGALTEPRLRRRLDTAVSSAQDVLSQTRRMVQALTPAELGQTSLPDAIRKAVSRSGLPAHVHIDGDPTPVPTPVAVALLRATQEALTNAARHAQAHRVDVSLTFLPEAISLDVIDDGIGFDPDQPYGTSTGTGLGLQGIRARTAEIDGTVDINSHPGQGTALNITVPHRSSADE